ncbi:MAG: FAD-binding and (Fe-S)-binding domain-containing protein [Candidatus Acidiferrales bacterium]
MRSPKVAPPIKIEEALSLNHISKSLAGRSDSRVDARGLETELRARTSGEVRFDNGSRGLYATDSSNYRQIPIGVVIPKAEDDVVQTMAICRQFQAPILARGGGTSLAGQCCNAAVVMDMSKYMHRILAVDSDRKFARVQPGTVLDSLRKATEKYELTFAPDPATHNHCTLGGMIGNNSCGVHSVMGGKTEDNVEELKIVTYDGVVMTVGKTSDAELETIISQGGRRGEIYSSLKRLRDKYANLIRERYPKIPRRVSGYNLDQLLPENGFHVARALVGTECTCVTVLEARLRLMWNPPKRSLLVLGYPDACSAADHIMEVLARKPIGLEGFDSGLVEDIKKKKRHLNDLRLLPDGQGWLLVEFGARSKRESDEMARGLMEELKKKQDAPSMKLYDDAKEEKLVWEIRESGLGATAVVPGADLSWPGWEDAAVPPEKLGNYLREFRKLVQKYGYKADLYGHFGQACIHTRINFDLRTQDGIKKFRSFVEAAADLVVIFGGSLSGEHGDGQSRAELLPKMFGHELVQAFREFKSTWDPEWKMNPGKVVDPYRIDENLRLGANYHPWAPDTHFQFPEDSGSFGHAALRCVGVGNCRRQEGGTMCPSYKVTREEEHSTRGRARLLFEMLEGEVVKDGWRNHEVREALDLCLACKGCKGECPVNVDMATYKAEFLSHYYKGRLRPVSAYSIGLIHRWARIATYAPGLVNFFTQTPVLRDASKFLAGIASARTFPRFAAQSFQSWFRQNRKSGAQASALGKVILWPDTFNNYFFPSTQRAALEALESLGFEVEVPQAHLCCGRPLYDYGMLGLARRLLERALESLRPQIRAGVPIVGLEPSCVAVFRDELTNLLPRDEDARRLSKQVFLLSEFIDKRSPDFSAGPLGKTAIVHGHCHQKALMGMNSDEKLLSKLGLDFNILDSGCCGMAGGFGFERDHYEVSVKVGETALLPAVRAASPDTLIIADGFSCREQISQCTNRHAMHIAEVLHMALRQQPAASEKR